MARWSFDLLSFRPVNVNVVVKHFVTLSVKSAIQIKFTYILTNVFDCPEQMDQTFRLLTVNVMELRNQPKDGRYVTNY